MGALPPDAEMRKNTSLASGSSMNAESPTTPLVPTPARRNVVAPSSRGRAGGGLARAPSTTAAPCTCAGFASTSGGTLLTMLTFAGGSAASNNNLAMM